MFVALGSHANYFVPDEVYPFGITIGNFGVHVSDRTGGSGRIAPQVISVPGREDVLAEPETWSGIEWLLYGGLWGELALQSDFGGPLGPAFKGEQMGQPICLGPGAAARHRGVVRKSASGDGSRGRGQALPKFLSPLPTVRPC